MTDRFDRHRRVGTKDRAITIDRDGDRLAKLAEDMVVHALTGQHLPADDARGADPGWDCMYGPFKVEARHTRRGRYLLHEKRKGLKPHLWVLVRGEEEYLAMAGWATRRMVEEARTGKVRDNGFVNYIVDVKELLPMPALFRLPDNDWNLDAVIQWVPATTRQYQPRYCPSCTHLHPVLTTCMQCPECAPVPGLWA